MKPLACLVFVFAVIVTPAFTRRLLPGLAIASRSASAQADTRLSGATIITSCWVQRRTEALKRAVAWASPTLTVRLQRARGSSVANAMQEQDGVWTNFYLRQNDRLETTTEYDRNLNTGGDNERDTRYIVVKQRILHDKAHPSFVRLPLIRR